MNKTNFFIWRNDTIAEVQGRFCQLYPNLEINFFSDNEKTQSINSCVMFSPEVRVRDISPDCQDGYIALNEKINIEDLETSIHDHFQLHAEISPRTGHRTVIVPHKFIHTRFGKPQISR